MKLIVFGLILICYNAWAAKLGDKFGNSMLEGFLEKFKETLKTGDEKLGIPVLDPFKSEELVLNLKEDIINLNATLKNVNVNGLAAYDVINGDYSLDGENVVLTLHLSWPLVVASTLYAMKGKADDFEIYGNGDITLSADHFAFDTEINFFLKDGNLNEHLKVTGMKLKLSLNKLNFKATGLFDDEELSAVLSSIISDMAPNLVSNDMIINKLIEFITQKLNEFLATKTMLELLLIILS